MRTILLLAVLLGLASRVHADAPAPTLAGVAERVRKHDDRGALSALLALPAEERSSPRATYLRARLLERRGRLADAAEALGELASAGLPMPIGEDVASRRLRLLARTGRCAEARSELERRAGLHGTEPLFVALAAECALELGANDDAVRWLSSLVRSTDASIDRLAILRSLAVALDRLDRGEEASARLREAFLADPAHPDAESLRESLRRRSASHAALGPRERESVVERLVGARAYERALAWLDEDGEPTGSEALARHLHLRGSILFAMRTHYLEAARTLDRAVRLRGRDALADELMAARAMLRAGDDAEATRRYDRLAERHPRTPEAREARYAAALIALRADGSRATHRMEVFLDEEGPRARGERIGEGHLLLAFHHLGHGSVGRAGPHLEAACRRRPDRITREGCAYFGARLAELSGEGGTAVSRYRSLAEDGPNEWYGLLARRRLVELGVDFRPPAPAPSPSTPVRMTLPVGVEFLVSIGLDEEAADLLHAEEARFRGEGLAGIATLVDAYARLGDAARSFRLARQGASSASGGDPALHAFFVRAMHPRPYADVVEALGPRLGVEPSYVYGTMRQESGFDPSAVSRVGAIGLLQLMPRTAARAAASVGLELEPAMLFDARTNVQVALAEMSELSRRYRGHIALVAASYNAGIAKTDEWLSKRHRLPLDLFVEAIPFDETRGYVKRVVGHAARYEALAGHPEAGLSFVLPLPEGPL